MGNTGYFICGVFFGLFVMLFGAFMLNLTIKKINWDKPITGLFKKLEEFKELDEDEKKSKKNEKIHKNER